MMYVYNLAVLEAGSAIRGIGFQCHERLNFYFLNKILNHSSQVYGGIQV